MTYAILFPGQGSQFVGMGAGLFDQLPELLGPAADEILGFSLAETCLEGPEETLTGTERAQPALYAVAYATWYQLSAELPLPASAAGHSLGEYTAHAAAGTFDFQTGLALVAERGRAMAEAAGREPSGMSAVLGIDVAGAEKAAAARRDEGGRLWVANINAPGQIVLSGGRADLEWLSANAGDFGGRRAIPLKVAGAFHSPFMEPARERLEVALASAEFREPAFEVFANASAAPEEDVKRSLGEQLVGPVRFQETLEAMSAAGVSLFVHVGPGEVTAGLVKRTLPEAAVVTVSGPEHIAEAVPIILSYIH